MTDAKDTPPDQPKNEPGPKQVVMTQEELNSLAGGIRTEARASYEKELAKLREEFEKERKLSSLKDEERAKAEKEIELKKLNDELSSYKRELAVRGAEAGLAKLGLDTSMASMVIGRDDDETIRNINALNRTVDDMVKKRLDGAIKAGAPQKGPVRSAGGTGVDEKRLRDAGYSASEIDEYLGRNKK